MENGVSVWSCPAQWSSNVFQRVDWKWTKRNEPIPSIAFYLSKKSSKSLSKTFNAKRWEQFRHKTCAWIFFLISQKCAVYPCQIRNRIIVFTTGSNLFLPFFALTAFFLSTAPWSYIKDICRCKHVDVWVMAIGSNGTCFYMQKQKWTFWWKCCKTSFCPKADKTLQNSPLDSENLNPMSWNLWKSSTVFDLLGSRVQSICPSSDAHLSGSTHDWCVTLSQRRNAICVQMFPSNQPALKLTHSGGGAFRTFHQVNSAKAVIKFFTALHDCRNHSSLLRDDVHRW